MTKTKTIGGDPVTEDYEKGWNFAITLVNDYLRNHAHLDIGAFMGLVDEWGSLAYPWVMAELADTHLMRHGVSDPGLRPQ
jgi:hypothetical protein